MQVTSFAEIEPEFMARVNKMVWCNVATVDTKGRPRSRILHPIWEGPVGWIGTRPTSLKAKHLELNPYVSLAYIADVAKSLYVDCRAEWIDDLDEKRRIWDMFISTPPPLGYDPAPIFGQPDGPNFGLLKLTPWRALVYNFPAENQIWQPDR